MHSPHHKTQPIRVAAWPACLLILVCLGSLSATEEEKDCNSPVDETSTEDDNYQKKIWADVWNLLNFHFEDSPLEKVELELTGVSVPVGENGKSAKRFNRKAYFVSTDQLFLDHVATYTNPIGIFVHAIPDGTSIGVSGDGGFTYAVLTLHTKDMPEGNYKKQKIVIGLTPCGFILGGRGGCYYRAFYSWGLAKTVDDFLLMKTGEGLPSDFIKTLSGESRIESQKKNYKPFNKKGEQKEQDESNDE